MPLQLDDLGLLDAPLPVTGAGSPLVLPIAQIDEDPDQPRTAFDPDALKQLADTIAQRGVRQPISVRPHAEVAGRWVLNFGARRLRASVLAGCTEIPAFVDATANSYDQVIENEQREGLQPLELALFVQRRLATGDSQSEIARRLGKGRAYVTYAMALIDAPEALMAAYREGRCRGLRELYELRRLHDTAPATVAAWLGSADAVTRADLQALKARLHTTELAAARPASTVSVVASPGVPLTHDPKGARGGERRAAGIQGVRGVRSSPSTAQGQRDAVCGAGVVTLFASYDGAEVVVDLSAVPGEAGAVFVVQQIGGERFAVPAAQVHLVRVAPSGV
jgi:ParB family transcriptional regulator, chromosome partitioning protein